MLTQDVNQQKTESPSRTCMVCSASTARSDWKNNKCPKCGQKYIPISDAINCPNCGFLTNKEDIIAGGCSKCRT